MKLNTFAFFALIIVGVSKSQQDFDYADALRKSILFYEAQRSGKLPDDNRIDWRGDSALDDLVTEGYYDAGDHVKFGFPLAYSLTMLAWGGIKYQAGYEAAGQLDYFKESLKWGTDYLIRAHPDPHLFYFQIGLGSLDHSFWGRPEDMTMDRPAYAITEGQPGSDVAAESAAALAAASIFYRNVGETNLADEALSHAKDLFEFADNYRGSYNDVLPEDIYNSYDYKDEIVWGACWLYKATDDAQYLTKAEQLFDEFGLGYPGIYGFGWDGKLLGVQALLYEVTGNSKYGNLVQQVANHYLYEATYTPKGLLYTSDWGSLRSSLNTVFGLLHIAEQGVMTSEIEDLAKSQIDYALGSTGRSFVVGFGNNPPTRPHHRAASCPDLPAPCDNSALESPDPNPQVLNGALVGGPDQDDKYTDDRNDYVHNEVALDYNCGFQGILAYIVQQNLQK